MIIGAMNDPRKKLADEIMLAGELSFDYIEVTVQAPTATPEIISRNRKEIFDALKSYNLGVLAHMPWYFPLSHPYASMQEASNREFSRAIEAAASLGAKKFTLHTDINPVPMIDREKIAENTVATLKFLNKKGREHGVDILVENINARSFSIREFRQLFSEVDIGMTLDIGHAQTSRGEGFDAYWKAFAPRVRHMHMHDNKTGEDDHLPLFAGRIEWQKIMPQIKEKYNESITLEIHASDPHYLAYSKQRLEEMWFGKKKAAEDRDYIYPKG